ARVAGEVHARLHQAGAEPQAAGVRVHQQDPQLRRTGVVTRHAEDAADAPAVELRDPRPLARRVAVLGDVGHDPGDQRLERAVPAELRRVLLAVREDHPAQVARPAELSDLHVAHRYPPTETTVHILATGADPQVHTPAGRPTSGPLVA